MFVIVVLVVGVYRLWPVFVLHGRTLWLVLSSKHSGLLSDVLLFRACCSLLWSSLNTVRLGYTFGKFPNSDLCASRVILMTGRARGREREGREIPRESGGGGKEGQLGGGGERQGVTNRLLPNLEARTAGDRGDMNLGTAIYFNSPPLRFVRG